MCVAELVLAIFSALDYDCIVIHYFFDGHLQLSEGDRTLHHVMQLSARFVVL